MLYAKVFRSMYDGTLAARGPWEALVTFTNMLLLSDYEGVIDMTPEAISRITTIPLDIIKKGIEALEAPDPQSRGEAAEGRRIVRLADHRDWGWQIVNFKYYRDLQSAEAMREGNRLSKQRQREKAKAQSSVVPDKSGQSRLSRHKELDVDVKKKTLVRSSPHDDVKFDWFWKAWPSTERKVAKAACRKKWIARNLDAKADLIISHVTALKKTKQWQDGFEPAPMTYINQSRWEDYVVGSEVTDERPWS